MKHLVLVLAIILALSACGKKELTPQQHEQEVLDWHQHRIERLLERQGWVSLAGMEEIKSGENTFGSDRSNDIIFPAGDMPRFGGTINRDGESISLQTAEGSTFYVDGNLFNGGEIYNPQDGAITLTKGTVDFLVIQRNEYIAVRIFDEISPYRVDFNGLELKPIDLKWRVTARFVENDEPKFLRVPNVLGQVNDLLSPGTLYFDMDGQEYSIDALEGNDNLFLIVGDQSNRSSTYGGGRYMYVDLPDRKGNITVDFNKIYNPPCAMNPYSTCNLPPPQNRLDIYINAGEKRYVFPDFSASL